MNGRDPTPAYPLSLTHYRKILGVLLDEDIGKEDIQEAIFAAVDVQILKAEMETIAEMLGNNYSDSLQRVITRHSYLRQFAPALIQHITFQADPQDQASDDIMEAVALLDRMNDAGKYAPEDAPTGFIPKKLRPFVFQDGKPYKPAWECALLTAARPGQIRQSCRSPQQALRQPGHLLYPGDRVGI